MRNFNPPCSFFVGDKPPSFRCDLLELPSSRDAAPLEMGCRGSLPREWCLRRFKHLVMGIPKAAMDGGVDTETGDRKSFIQQSALMSLCPLRRGCQRGRREFAVSTGREML